MRAVPAIKPLDLGPDVVLMVYRSRHRDTIILNTHPLHAVGDRQRAFFTTIRLALQGLAAEPAPTQQVRT